LFGFIIRFGVYVEMTKNEQLVESN